jgi:hypothetical protein
MNPPMHKRVRNLFADAGLTDGFKVQLLMWRDSEKSTDSFIVFRPNGGTQVDRDRGSEYYVLVDVISGADVSFYESTDTAVQRIIEYVQQNPISDSCVGQILNMGGIPSPVTTTEGRLVYRLQFRCIYGE